MSFLKSIRSNIQSLLSNNEGSLASVLARGVSATFILKVWYTLWLFGVSVLLARILGTEGFGIYSVAMSWSALIAVFAKLGQDKTACRYVASYHEMDDIPGMRGIVFFSVLLVSLVGFMLAAGATAILNSFFMQIDPETKRSLTVAFWLVPLQAVLTATGAVCQGLSRVIRAQIPVLLVSPLAFLGLLSFTTGFYTKAITPSEVIVLTIAAQGIALGLLVLSTRTVLPREFSQVRTSYRLGEWLAMAIPVMLMGGMYVINMNADIVMLGVLASSEAAGVYKAATRGADLVIFSLLIINPVLSPIVTKLHTRGERDRLQRGITRVARIGLMLSLPIAVFLIAFGGWFLSLFGPDYVQGRIALGILCIGQLINVAAGSVAMILIMTGNERSAALGVGVSTVVNIVLNVILIPKWGIEGAAVATAISIVLWNVLLVRSAWKLLGVDTTSLGLFVPRGESL